ncbi:MAG: (Fe-S)-binding protein [Acidimicrobiales bacterium]|nr:(Fe-S)-binding protein [Acidimicrobiales bacterium]
MTGSSSPRTGGVLDLRDDALASCVACGLCLPHCPTYRVTGDERRSPRGRIALMRAVDEGATAPDAEWLEAMDTCILCRGCETACPSAVPFGELMSDTRAAGTRTRQVPFRLRVGLAVLVRPRLLRGLSRILALLQRLHLLPARLPLPGRLPLRDPRQKGRVGGDVVLFTGCVMDAWQPEVHAAVEEVLEACGATVRRSGDAAGCCGALHAHAGLEGAARSLAERVMAAIPEQVPVLVDSAGCGATLRGYGSLVGTPAAAAFSARVQDVHEWLAADIDRMPAATVGKRLTVIVQDPCHLRHAQGCHGSVRTVLVPYADTVELDDEGLCCGAGGAFSVLQPELASEVRLRKTASIRRAMATTGAEAVVSANPGCAIHLATAGHVVRHPLEVVAERIRGKQGGAHGR